MRMHEYELHARAYPVLTDGGGVVSTRHKPELRTARPGPSLMMQRLVVDLGLGEKTRRLVAGSCTYGYQHTQAQPDLAWTRPATFSFIRNAEPDA